MCGKGKYICHQISTFPEPFCFQKTPYIQKDFSDSVKNISNSLRSVLNGVRMCKIIVLGDVNVGKTSIVNRFSRQIFSFSYKPTIGVDFEIEQFNILKIPFSMQIWDTAGQERFKCIAAAYYRSAHVIVIVFDLSKISTLNHSLEWLNEALNSNTGKPLKFLVGTKKDLLKNAIYSEVENRAAEMANFMEAEYWAVSSKTGKGIKELFYRIAALSFEEIIKAEMQNSEEKNFIQLGQNLLSENKKMSSKRKRCMNCESH